MDKKRSSVFSSLFPWTSPFVITFAIVKGGIEVQLFRNNRQIIRWHASKLRRSLPEPLFKWIEDNHLTTGAQPYPSVKQLWYALLPLASKKLLIDASELTLLQETSQPPDLAMNWRLNQNLACIEGNYSGADNYLGLGWFQKGHLVWPLRQPFPQAAAYYLENLTVPLEQAGVLLTTVIPALQSHFAARADFQLITDFAVNVVVQDAQHGRLTLTLESNYPQLLSTLSIPQQKTDFLLAQQALIRFPRQALTPVLMHLFQGKGTPASLQGEDVPLFIKEQLPAMRQCYQISDDMAQKITQANPIVSIATLKPDFSFPIHTIENGIGKYSTAATYQYQNHTLNMHELLNRRKRQQRFVSQHGIWFEWPENSQHLAQTIQQTLVPRALLQVELMGLVPRQQDLLQKGLLQIKPHAYTIQPEGNTAQARAQSLFQQLQYHGVPGGISGEPAGLVNMLLNACEKLVRDNWHARILWLTTSNKKGAVTRALNASKLPMHAVTVASPVTLRDSPGLFLQQWTLVIFHGLDQLQLDNSAEVWKLPQLKWNWALLSAVSLNRFNPFTMQILHLPEQYSQQFCERYLFDVEKIYRKLPTGQEAAGLQAAQTTRVSEVKSAPTTPPAQEPKGTAPRRVEPAASATSLFSTHEITIPNKASPLPPARSRFVPSPAFSFWEQAQLWKNHTHGPVPLEKFEHTTPTYLDMQKPGVLEYYFYWRSEVRSNRYPATDTGYILIHVYEAIARIGFATSASALNRLIDLWAHYRESFPILDQWLVPWIADFCVVYNVPYQVMDWYSRLLTIPDYRGEAQLLAEAWLRQGGDWAQMPSALLYALIQWTPALPLNLKKPSQHVLYKRYHQALNGIDRYLREQKGIHGIVGRYGQGQSVAVERIPFSGALVERQHAPTVIEKVNVAFTTIEFRQTVIAILRYADYISQQAQPIRTAVPPTHIGIGIDKNWQKAIEAALTSEPRTQASQSVGQTAQKAEPVVNQPPVRPQISSLTNTEARPVVPAGRPTIELNPTKIAQLHDESEYLQERLTVEETAPSLPAIQIPPSLLIQPVPAAKQEQEQQAVAQRLETTETVYKEPAAASLTNPLEIVKGQTNEKNRKVETTVLADQSEKKAGQTATSSQGSALEQRVLAMKLYWQAFDEIHTRQTKDMPPLRVGTIANPLTAGFEHRYRFDRADPFPPYQQLLPARIFAEIERLWGTVLLPRWPEHIVNEPFPHELFIETFGVALNFWHSCSLNIWFFCDNVLSISDLGDLAEFYRKDIQTFKDMGTPLNRQLFAELSEGGKQLRESQSPVASRGTSKKVFVKLRDILSNYRRQWADAYLDKYLQKRWEAEIHEMSLSYQFTIDDTGTTPTVKQFAKEAKNVINHWFGGDISALYTAIHVQSPIQPQCMAILPFDRDIFATTIAETLVELKNQQPRYKNATVPQAENRSHYLNKLVEYGFQYIQLEEALGYAPALSNFGSATFVQYSHVLDEDINKAWALFSRIIMDAKQASMPIRPDTISSMAIPMAQPVQLQVDVKASTETEEANASPAQTVLLPIQQLPAQVNAEKNAQDPKAAQRAMVNQVAVPGANPAVQLDQEAISKLQEESEYLQERLIAGMEEAQGSLEELVASELVEKETIPTTPGQAKTSVVSSASRSTPEVDEDWQVIYPQWRAEHWEILRLLCQGKTLQFSEAEHKKWRPLSLLLDEINGPVDEQLNDLLIDAEAQTLFPHLRTTVEHLVRWYYSSESR